MLNTLAYEPTNAEKDYHQYMKKKDLLEKNNVKSKDFL